jgi:hypothetical protein
VVSWHLLRRASHGGSFKNECTRRQERKFSVAQTERIFYDGPCGLCQPFVRFVVQRDRAGTKFRFAPLQGPTFESVVPIERRAAVPDSMVVLTSDHRLLIRSDGVTMKIPAVGASFPKVSPNSSAISPPRKKRSMHGTPISTRRPENFASNAHQLKSFHRHRTDLTSSAHGV